MAVNLRWRALKGGTKKAYLDINHNGERKYEFLDIKLFKNDIERKEKKRLADAIRAKRELELTTGTYDFTAIHHKKADFVKYFQNYIDSYTKKDIRRASSTLGKFKSFIERDAIQFQEITPLVCEQFMDYLKYKSSLKGSTPGDYWKRFKSILKLATKEGIISKNPADGIIFKGHSKHDIQLKKNVLTTAELQSIASAYCGNTEVKRAFLLACYTGLGMAEIRQLKWERITNGKIRIFREKNGEQIINDLHPVAVKLLGKHKNPDKFIFLLPSDSAVKKNITNWLKKAEIEKKITFYCGRHTFATQLLMNGANLKTVADCMGHANTRHTIKYLNYVDSLKSDAISNLPGIVI
jgi:integrase